jgi:hypothetical protein
MRKLLSAFVVTAALAGAADSARGALLYATGTVTGASVISRFDSDALGSVTTVPVTGLQAGETLVGIDVRPAGGFSTTLYGLGSTSRLYIINPLTGTATQVGASQLSTLLNGTAFGFDFNPAADLLRSVSNTEQNLRINATTGALVAADSALNPAGNIVATAYNNNVFGAASTTLFAIDSAAGTLVMIGSVNGTPNSPNTGIITTVGSLGLGTNLNESIGFDIQGTSTTGSATITTGGISRLYTVNLSTGAATLAPTNGGAIGTGTVSYLGVAATPAPEPGTTGLVGLAAAGLLFRRRRAAVA